MSVEVVLVKGGIENPLTIRAKLTSLYLCRAIGDVNGFLAIGKLMENSLAYL